MFISQYKTWVKFGCKSTVSQYIVRTKVDYYRLLNEVTSDQAWEAWALYLLEAVEQTAIMTTAKIAEARELIEITREHVACKLPKTYSYELLTVIFEQPYCRRVDWEISSILREAQNGGRRGTPGSGGDPMES